jgi:hypothetical protein
MRIRITPTSSIHRIMRKLIPKTINEQNQLNQIILSATEIQSNVIRLSNEKVSMEIAKKFEFGSKKIELFGTTRKNSIFQSLLEMWQ